MKIEIDDLTRVQMKKVVERFLEEEMPNKDYIARKIVENSLFSLTLDDVGEWWDDYDESEQIEFLGLENEEEKEQGK